MAILSPARAGEKIGDFGGKSLVPGRDQAAQVSTASARVPRRTYWFRRTMKERSAISEVAPEIAEPSTSTATATVTTTEASTDEKTTDTANSVQEAPVQDSAATATASPAEAPASGEPPSPEEVDRYRMRLEERLLERYANLPEFAGRVAVVSVVLSRPLDVSMDGSLIRAEFDQLVYDHWGNRLPDLEKEYYVVTFGSGGVQQVRADPSIRVGLDMEKTFSERAPLIANPFRNVETNEAFKPAPNLKMPSWWRPDFPELGP